jgi:hypothetical protein
MDLRVARRQSCAWNVKASGCFIAERFVGTLLVVDTTELIEALLLRTECLGGRNRGVLFQRSMHPFMSAVLLRLPRLDTLVHDA